MECPRCHERTLPPLDTCPRCGADLNALQLLWNLQNSLARARANIAAEAARVREAESELAALERRLVTAAAATPSPAPSPAPLRSGEAPPPDVAGAESTILPEPPSAHVPRAGGRPPSVWREAAAVLDDDAARVTELQIGQRWLLVAGLVAVILAAGYFLKYAFDRNWITPWGRVLLVYAGGTGLIGIGELFRRRSFDVFGLYIIGGGVAVLYSAGYAAYQLYQLIGQTTAFGLMTLVTVLAGALALRYDTKWLAVLGIIGGFLTPMVLRGPVDNQIGLMSYMLVLNGGILAIAAFRRWPLLNLLGFVSTWLLFIAWFQQHYAVAKFWPTVAFLNAFFLTYAVGPFAYYFLRSGAVAMEGFAIVVPNAFIAFGFLFAIVREYASRQAVGLFTVAYAALFFAMAGYLRRRNREAVPAFVVLIGKGTFFLMLTVPIVFSRHWITVFWSVEAVVLCWAALVLHNRYMRGVAEAMLIAIAVKFLAYDQVTHFHLRADTMSFHPGYAATLTERWTTAAVVLGSIGQSARMLARAFRGSAGGEPDGPFVYGVLATVLFAVLNLETAGYFFEAVPAARFAAISVLWGSFAIALMGLGFRFDRGALRVVALGLFAVTVGKVFLRDMARVSTPYRIVSFLAVGVLLIGASFLYHRYRSRIVPDRAMAGSGGLPPRNAESGAVTGHGDADDV